MDSLIQAIRTRLNDQVLTGTVAHNDITASYNPETANYPCVVLSIVEGASGAEPYDTARATVQIDVYSRTNKLQCWTIYNRVKTLLHSEQVNLTSADRKIIWVHEISVSDSGYDLESDAWHLIATYDIMYHETGIIVYSAANGVVYADENDVSRSSTQLGYFRGGVRVELSYEYVIRNSQERFGKEAYFNKGDALITLEQVNFVPARLNLVWGVTYNASDTLSDDSTAATSYAITQSTAPRYLQLLFRATRTYDLKVIEIEADRVVCDRIYLPMLKTEIALSNYTFRCFADANDNVLKVSIEN